MKYLSVCSGIEAASVAWGSLGFKPVAFSEIEAFPSAVLKHHYPHVPNAGDFTAIQGKEYGYFDILVGGTPCQSFSVAGKRGGLSDERGNLALEYIKLAYRSRPEFIVWENVPGVFSSGKGNDFRCFLHGLTGVDVPVPQKGWKNSGLIVGLPGHYSIAWRVLDAQFAGVPQRRRRVFVVGHLGDWRRATAVLFERESLLWNPTPSREKGQRVAGTITSGFGERGVDADQISNGNYNVVGIGIGGSETGYALRATPSHSGDKGDGGVNCNLAVLREREIHSSTGETAHCLNAGGMGRQDFETETLLAVGGFPNSTIHPAVAYGIRTANTRTGLENGVSQFSRIYGEDEPIATLNATGSKGGAFSHAVFMSTVMAVRRLTPRECERLQGFPDDYTLVPFRNKPAADGPRYKAIGNSMAVPVMNWIGRRIQVFSKSNLGDHAITTLPD